jgi:hypothetical protein
MEDRMLQTVEFVINFSPIETLEGGTATLHHEVQAFDMLRIEVPAGAAGTTIELVPPHSRIHFLGIFRTSGGTSTSNGQLFYSVSTDPTRFLLEMEMPHFMSAPLISLLQPAPESLNFYNEDTDPVDVMILVGRDAAQTTNTTPIPPPQNK